jgi:hypothetical protein
VIEESKRRGEEEKRKLVGQIIKDGEIKSVLLEEPKPL